MSIDLEAIERRLNDAEPSDVDRTDFREVIAEARRLRSHALELVVACKSMRSLLDAGDGAPLLFAYNEQWLRNTAQALGFNAIHFED